MTVPAAFAWPTNGHLIEAVAELGYLDETMPTLDPTYGLGAWWKRWQPTFLTRTDLNPAKSPDWAGGSDFTALPWADGVFAAVAFDPPYKLNGTASGPDGRYGVDARASWQDRQGLIEAGLHECRRVLAVGGTLLVKCQAQVCSGKVRWQPRVFANYAEDLLDLDLVDEFHMLGTGRPQPAGRRQVHAHGRPSTLLVFRRP